MHLSRRSLAGLAGASTVLLITGCAAQPGTAPQLRSDSGTSEAPSGSAATYATEVASSASLPIPENWPSELYLPPAKITANKPNAVNCEFYVSYSTDLAVAKETMEWYRGRFPITDEISSVDILGTPSDAKGYAISRMDGGAKYGAIWVTVGQEISEESQDPVTGQFTLFAMEVILGVGRPAQ